MIHMKPVVNWYEKRLKPSWFEALTSSDGSSYGDRKCSGFIYEVCIQQKDSYHWMTQATQLQTANLKIINLTTASIHSSSSWNICIMKLDRIQCVSTVWQVRNRTISVDSFRSWKFIWNKNISNRKHETSKHLSIFHLFVIFIHINLYTNVFVLVN